MESRLLPLLSSPDPAALHALLRDDVAFHSPFADYRGREDVARLFAIIPTVLRDLRVDRALERPGEVGTFVTASVGGKAGEAFISERYEDERIAEVTLMLRPYSTLKIAIGLMAEALGR